MLERLAGHAEVGDRVAMGFLELIVRDTDDSGAITAAGLALAPETPAGASGWPVLRGFVDIAAILRRRFPSLPRLRSRNPL